MAVDTCNSLLDRLPSVRGRLEADAPLTRLTWFRTGGPAEALFRPADEDDLRQFLERLDPNIPLTVLGVGSNVLVRDGGIRGVVIHLGKPFGHIDCTGVRMTAGAGATDIAAARAAAGAGIAGLEFLRGIPGTLGGALRMNAGAYGSEFSDIFLEARAIDRHGHEHVLDADAMGFSYRSSTAASDLIFTSVLLEGRAGDPETITRRMDEIADEREGSQPVRSRTGGSTFKNPPIEESGGRKAWELIADAGCRGLVIGDAQVSEKHCNFLINLGQATSSDLERLGEEVRHRVLDATGVALEWEIRRVGVHREGGR